MRQGPCWQGVGDADGRARHLERHGFRYAELREFVIGLFGLEPDLYRNERNCIYATLQKPE